jgi:DnaK suppressor protein
MEHMVIVKLQESQLVLARLEARPVTTLSIEAQEMHERSEKLHSDD